ncbi:hypothetical protein PInf_006615 [Phytophthora infestans]|nr:hypothetical protein PInf_006615 [Phytophthora infestans]
MKVLLSLALLLAPYEVSAACSSWSSLYQDVLEGVCVCNETQCDSIVSGQAKLTEGEVGVYSTSKDGARFTYTVVNIDESPNDEPTFFIEVKTQYQTMLGFGGALTDAAAINQGSE